MNMNAMKKLVSMLLAVIMVLGTVSSSALAGFTLPGALVEIQQEAFLGNSAITGVVELPETVKTVGANAFGATGVYALTAHAGVEIIGQQSTTMAYLMAAGSATQVEGSGWAKFAIAPQGSAVQTWAGANGVAFVAVDDVVGEEPFLYQVADGEATLLCAIDNTLVPAEVVIPDEVGEYRVTALSANAFFGCAQVTSISVPAGLEVAQGAYDGCPSAEVTVREDVANAPVVKYFSQGEDMLFGSWNAVEGAVSYEMGRLNGEEYVIIENPTKIKDTMYSAHDFVDGANIGHVTYAVRAVFADGSTSAWSEPFEMVTLGKVSTAAGRQTGNNTLTLEWSAVENAEYYMISVICNNAVISNIDAEETFCVVELPADADRTAEYTCRIYACNTTGNGKGSDPVVFSGLQDFAGTQLALSASKITFSSPSESALLTAEVTSDTLTDKSVTWTVHNDYIAWVDDEGRVYPNSSGRTYVIATTADGVSARCLVEVSYEKYAVSLSNVSEAADEDGTIQFTLTTREDYVAIEDAWLPIRFTYFDADGGVLGFDNWGFELSSPEETIRMHAEYAGAASVELTIEESDFYEPGEVYTAEISLAGANVEMTYQMSISAGTFYPGGKARLYFAADDPDGLTGEKIVTASSEDGLLQLTLGKISQETPVLDCDFTIPQEWQYTDGTEATEYYIEVTVEGSSYTYGRYLTLMGFNAPNRTVTAGQTLGINMNAYCRFPLQQPLVFEVENENIATISETGAITGVAVGQTNATVTTATGHSKTFTITVTEPSSGGESGGGEQSVVPALYIYAPNDTVNYEPNIYPTYFYAAAEVPGTLVPGTSYPMLMTLYDENMNFVDSLEDDALYAENDSLAAFWFNPDSWGENIHYVEATLLEGENNTVSTPSTAIVQIIYPEEAGEGLHFEQLSNEYHYYAPGQSFTIPITCTTPELIDGTAEIRVLANHGAHNLASLGTLSLTPEEPSGVLNCTLSPNAIHGEWVNLYIYCGKELIGNVEFGVHSGVSVKVWGFEMSQNTTRQLPVELADGIEMTDLYLSSSDESVVTVDENGFVTAVGVGEADIFLFHISDFGYTMNQSLWIRVTEAAADELPVVSMDCSVTEAAYGAAIPLTFTVEGTAPDADFGISYMASLLDANKNVLAVNWMNTWPSAEELAAGYETTLSRWPSSDNLQNAAYLYLLLMGDSNDPANIVAADCSFLIEITEIPEGGETTYSYEWQQSEPFRPGMWLYGVLRRFEALGDYPDASVELQDADGNVIYSGYWYEYNAERDFTVRTTDMAPMTTHTLYLYINGEKTDLEISFYLDEPLLGISAASRLALGSTSTASYRFDTSSDYTTDVTFESSNPEVLSIDPTTGLMTGNSAGMATVTAKTAGGQTAQAKVIVYDANNAKTPELYLIPSTENPDYSGEWFDSMPVMIGTTTELYYVSSSLYAGCRVEFLDGEGNVLCTETLRNNAYLSMSTAERQVWLYPTDELWLQAFQAGAACVRFTLTTDSSYAYTIDENRNSVTFALPDPSEHLYPVVTYTATKNVAAGGVFSATFTCINPSALTRQREVKLYDDQRGEYVATGYLTAAEPEITLTYSLPSDWVSGNRMRVYYPSNSGSGTVSEYIYTTVSAITHFSEDKRVAVGSSSYLYPSYSGDAPTVTYSTSDESIATVESTGGVNAKVTGVAPGVATITLTTDGGTSMSMKMVVYDSANTIKPVLWMDQAQNGSEITWEESSSNVALATSTDPWLIGSNPSVRLLKEYLDADGEVLYSLTETVYVYSLFLDGKCELNMNLEPAKAYARGASAVRITLQANANDYTLAEENLSVTLNIGEPAETTEPVFVVVGEDFAMRDEAYRFQVCCLNPELLGGEYTVEAQSTASGEYGTVLASGTLSAENARADMTIQPKAGQTDLYFYVYVRNASNSTVFSEYQNVILVNLEVYPTVVAVGESISPSYSHPGYTALTPVFSSLDESIATVDSASGQVTGVAAGSTVLHMQCGPLYAEAPIRVYDPAKAETANLSLAIDENQPEWPWIDEQGEYTFTVKADKAAEVLAGPTYVNLDVSFYDADGNKLNNSYGTSFTASFASGNEEVIALENTFTYADSARRAYDGAVEAVLTINGVYDDNYSIDAANNAVRIPMISLEETDDPLYYVEDTLPNTLTAGGSYTLTAKAGNPYMDQPYYLLVKTQDYSGEELSTRSGSTNYRTLAQVNNNPAQAQLAELSFVIPEGLVVDSNYISLDFYYVPVDGSEEETFITGYGYPIQYGPYTVTALADLQSAHNYASYSNHSWLYTVEGATSLAVTFDAQTKTESSFDYLYVGTAAELEQSSFANRYSGTSLAGQTVTVEGDTVAIKLTSDYSSEYWGFAVTQIVATMADGSTVTITE